MKGDCLTKPWIPIAVAIAIVIAGSVVYRKVKLYDNCRITSPSVFRLSNNKQLTVLITDDGYVDFWIDEKGTRLIKSTEKASTYQKWDLIWEFPAERLWFNSADIGFTAYTKDGSGKYLMSYVLEKSMIESYKQADNSKDLPPMIPTENIPDVVWDNLHLYVDRPVK